MVNTGLKVMGITAGIIAVIIAVAFLSIPKAGDPYYEEQFQQILQEREEREKLAEQARTEAITPVDMSIVRVMPSISFDDYRKNPDVFSDITISYGGHSLNYLDLGRDIHNLINKEREHYGLTPLNYDPNLTMVAHHHSSDMATNNYFDHDSPDGTSPAERGYEYGYYECGDLETLKLKREYESLLKQFEDTGRTDEALYNKLESMRTKINTAIEKLMIFDGISENIAQVGLYGRVWVSVPDNIPTSVSWVTKEELATEVVYLWMMSPEHKENVLTPYFHSEGIGIEVTNDHKVYVTQNFC